jgi:hypothetical protein
MQAMYSTLSNYLTLSLINKSNMSIYCTLLFESFESLRLEIS